MYTRNLSKSAKYMGPKQRTDPRSSFRSRQNTRNYNRMRAPALGRVRYTPTLRREVKCIDTTFQAAYNAVWVADTFPQRILNANSTASLQSLSLIQQGPGLSQRIGNKVSLKSLRLRFSLFPTANVSAVPTDTRVMIIYDRQPNGQYPAINDILNSLDQTNVLTNPVLSYLATTNLNPNNFERFTVLMDKSFTAPTYETEGDTATCTGPTGNGQNSPWWIDEYIKLRGLECCFKGTTNPEVVGDLSTGNLFILSVGESVAALTSWAFQGTARLRFNDN